MTHKILLVKICAKLTSTLCNFPSNGIVKKSIIPFLTNVFYHKNLYDFFPRYFSTHLRNTLLVDDMPYKTYQNPPFNAIFIESYKEVLKEDNYFLRTLFLNLDLFYSWFHVPTFVEDYRFGTIRSFKENDVKF